MSYEWAQFIDGTVRTPDQKSGITIDSSGNVYVTGITNTSGFQITTVSGTVTKPSFLIGTFIAKYNSSGECLWAQFIDGSGNDIINSIKADSSGNVYIAGNLRSPDISFTTVSNTVITKPNPSTNLGAFVAKLNSSGQYIWVQFIDGPSEDYAIDVSIDTIGNVYMTGYTNTSGLQIKTVSGTVTKPSFNQGAYVVKYNLLGECQWAKFIDGVSSEYGISITVDTIGNVYTTGYTFTSGLQISTVSGTVTRPSIGSNSLAAFIIKYNLSGDCQWVQFIDGIDNEYAESIAVDTIGNIYMTVKTSTSGFQLSTVSGTVTKPNNEEPNNGIFILKYNPSGECQWAQFIDGINDEENSIITTDLSGNIYLSGYTNTSGFQVSTVSGNVTGPSIVSLNINAAFFLKYNPSGVCQWAQFIDGYGDERSRSIAVDTSGIIYITGVTNTSGFQITTASGTVTKLSSNTGIFILKFIPPQTTPVPTPPNPTPRFIFPPGDQSDQRTTNRRGDRALSSGYRKGPVDYQTYIRMLKGRASGCC